MVGICKGLPLYYGKNINVATVGKDKTSKNLFNAALKSHMAKQMIKKQNVADDIEKQQKQIDAKKKESWKFNDVISKSGVIQALKYIGALIYVLVIIYIMYYILDMAFGPKDYKLKKRAHI